MALGIGANAAIFSIVNAVLLRPLAHSDSERLVKIVPTIRNLNLRDIGLSVSELDDLRAQSDVFADVSAVWPISANLTGGDRPERVEALAVSPNYFSMLGAQPELGHLFGAQDVGPGFSESVVISDAAWHRYFGGDPNVLGRRLQLDNDGYTVTGVLPPQFRHPGATIAGDVEMWVTAGFAATPFPKPTRSIRLLPTAIGKIRPGVTVQQAQERTHLLAEHLRATYPTDYPPNTQWSIDLEPLRESVVGHVRPMLLVLLGSVMLIALVAAVNLANLLMARATVRRQEMAIRQALGASRAMIVRQLLTESLLLSVVGGALGILVAGLTMKSIVALIPATVPRLSEISIDTRVLGVSLALSLLTGILFGLAPALQSARTQPVEGLREGTLSAGNSTSTSRIRGLLIAAEFATAVVLVVGAGLLLRTFWSLVTEDPGFNSSRLVTAGLWLPAPNDPTTDRYGSPERLEALIRQVKQRVESIPGVQSVAVTTHIPATAVANRARVSIEGATAPSDLTAEIISVTPNYFQTMEIAFAHGNPFAEDDKVDSIVVDENAVRRFWPDQDPIGKRLQFGNPRQPRWMTVVGILKPSKQDAMDVSSELPHIYRSIYRTAAKGLNITIRTAAPTNTMEQQLKHAIESVDPGLPVFNVRTMDEVISDSLAARRFSVALVGGFGALALLLSVLGIYGLLAYLVGQRSREIAIRLALGAQPRSVQNLIMLYGVRLSLIGVTVGLGLAFAGARLLSPLLFHISPWDPMTFTVVPLTLFLAACTASLIPSRRVTKVEPAMVLRNQ
jgi:putative ABC transport system permease protein